MLRTTKTRLKAKFLEYLLQVSLIILGLVIATSADRCNTRRKSDRTLQEYYAAIRTDLAAEDRSNQYNIGDAERDVASLDSTVWLFTTDSPDSLVLGVKALTAVLAKGVFRTFSPTTFDVMVNTGDVSLIKDLELRSELAALFAFRTDIVAQDLADYNRQVLLTLESIGDKIDLNCIVGLTVTADCIKSPTRLAEETKDELLVLQRVATSRLFHLSMYQEQVLEMTERVGVLLE